METDKMLSALEESYRSYFSQSDYYKISKLKYEYNSILSKRVNRLWLKLKQKQFELGNKPERLLANQLRGEQVNRAIHAIKSKSGVFFCFVCLLFCGVRQGDALSPLLFNIALEQASPTFFPPRATSTK